MASLTIRGGYNTVDRMRLPGRTLAAAFAFGLIFHACSEKLSRQTGLTDADLYAKAVKELGRKDFGDAAEAYQVLLERFPNSPLAAKAQLSLADARMENGDDIEAEVAFDDFLRLYPADDNVPYALFRKGELLFRQAGDPGRDQTKVVESIRTFSLLLERHPGGPHAAKAAERIRALRDRLAAHEGKVVSHYIGRKRFESAEARARRALAEYPDTAGVPPLLSLLAEALDGRGRSAEAAEVRKTLSEKFPGFGEKKK